jgi:hypothetical protein
MIRIYVDSIQEKQKIMAESRYLHDLSVVDSDRCNTLIHLYLANEVFIIDRELPYL